MSYTLQVWDEPIPRDLAEAERILSELHRARGTTNAKLANFAKQLNVRLPANDEDEESSALSEGPLDATGAGASYSFAIESWALDDAVPIVLEVARGLRLVVYDGQAGEVYLPDGTTLTAPGCSAVVRRAAPDSEERLPTKPRAQAVLVSALSPVFEPHGFDVGSGPTPFKRRSGDCTQLLGISFSTTLGKMVGDDYWQGWNFSFLPVVRIKLPKAYAAVVEPPIQFYMDLARLAKLAGIPPLRASKHGKVVFIADRCDEAAGRSGNDLRFYQGRRAPSLRSMPIGGAC